MPTKVKGGSTKGNNKRASKPSTSASTVKTKKAHGQPPKEQKTKSAPSKDTRKKVPPHAKYTEKDLKLPSLNGIKPAGVQKAARAKKGKTFVEDRESMNAIMAMVMAEKEGNIESKMMRARQLEEVREARKAEMEKRSESKKAGLEERKKEIKNRKRRHSDNEVKAEMQREERIEKKPKKRVSFG